MKEPFIVYEPRWRGALLERSEQRIALRLKDRASEVELRTYLWSRAGHSP